MADLQKIVRASMKSLVGWFGCLDAAAETINARWDGSKSSKSIISRKISGTLEFTISDAIALEDAAGKFPVTNLLARRLENRPQAEHGCLVAQSGMIAKECGEAVAAILSAEQSACADDGAEAIVEINQAIHKLKAAREALRIKGGSHE